MSDKKITYFDSNIYTCARNFWHLSKIMSPINGSASERWLMRAEKVMLSGNGSSKAECRLLLNNGLYLLNLLFVGQKINCATIFPVV